MNKNKDIKKLKNNIRGLMNKNKNIEKLESDIEKI